MLAFDVQDALADRASAWPYPITRFRGGECQAEQRLMLESGRSMAGVPGISRYGPTAVAGPGETPLGRPDLAGIDAASGQTTPPSRLAGQHGALF
jgi:hypothetical protein